MKMAAKRRYLGDQSESSGAGNRSLQHEYRPEYHDRHVQLSRSTRRISQRHDETCGQNGEVDPFEHHTENLPGWKPELRVSQTGRQDSENKEEVALFWKSETIVKQPLRTTHDGKPRKQHGNRLIQELDVEHEFSHE